MRPLLLLCFLAGLTILATWSCTAALGVPTNTTHGFIVAHSHCDAGWRLTLEQYYDQQVRFILDNSIQSLLSDVNRKFIWVETAYFAMWFAQQNQTIIDDVISLVERGQLEFVHGGWVMADEASADPFSRINQITVGHEFLLEHLGVKPRYGWQIDPFGGSSITPTLFRNLGYNAFVHDRISLRIKNERMSSKELQFVWRGSENLGEASELFTHVLDNWYWQPSGFNWDEGDPPVTDANIKQLSDKLVGIIKDRSRYFRTPHVLYPFGHDFAFQDSEVMFENMDKLIAYVNERSASYQVTLSYSTLSDFFEVMHNTGEEWPEFTQDYLPFEDNPWSIGSCFWVGHYTSRPQLKSLARKTDSVLKSAESLFVYGPHNLADVQHGRETAGLMNHHDAITGTSKQLVVDDYVSKMRAAITRLYDSIATSVALILQKPSKPEPAFIVLDEDETLVLQDTSLFQAVVIHNPLGWARDEIVRIRIELTGVTSETEGTVQVRDELDQLLPSQVIPVWDQDSKNAVRDLYFPLSLAPLALGTVFIRMDKFAPIETKISFPSCGSAFEISSPDLKLQFNEMGRLSTSANLKTGFTVKLNQDFLEYSTVESGAYLFTPLGVAESILPDDCPETRVATGPLVSVVEQRFPETVRQTVRLFSLPGTHVAQAVEIVVNVDGAITPNKELITRFSTDIQNSGRYYTDNGLEMVARDFDDSWEHVEASNYRPIISVVSIRDERAHLAVISAQAHGVASLNQGELEVMLQRRLMQDDNLGMEEAMNETAPCQLKFFLVVGDSQENMAVNRHSLTQVRNNPLVVLRSEAISSVAAWVGNYTTSFTPVAKPFPDNVHLLSFQRRNAQSDTVVIRLVHLYEVGEHPELSQEAVVDLGEIFAERDLTDLEERSLSLRDPVEELNKTFRWTAKQPSILHGSSPDQDLSETSLQPIQIRSFFTSLSQK